MIESCDVLQSSANLLTFCVDDMISLSQIESDKFRKNCGNMDVQKSVNYIMAIQQTKADFNNISLNAKFINFDNYMVCTDQHRLQQVLLNL